MKTVLDFWSSYTFAIRLIVCLVINIVIITWMFLLPWLQNTHLEKSKQSKKLNASQTSKTTDVIKPLDLPKLPAILSGVDIEAIRAINNVRGLTKSENELNLYKLPNGIFGWVEVHRLDSPTMWIVNSPFNQDYPVLASNIKLRTNRQLITNIEVHKDINGTVRLLAFVNDSSRIELQQPNRNKAVNLLLAFRSYEEYRCAVSIPRERFQSFHHRTFSDGEYVADACVI